MQTVHLTATEDGYLMRLRDQQWLLGAVPIDESAIFSRVRAPDADHAIVRKVLGEFFEKGESGYIDQSILEERDHSERVAAERAEAGQRGAAARWSSRGQRRAPNTKSMANAIRLPEQNDGDHNTTHHNTSDHQISSTDPSQDSDLDLIPEGSSEISHSRKSPPARGSRMPQDWELPTEWKAWALGATGGRWPESRVMLIAAKFKDHWLSKPGAAGVKADWLATWRNWIREEVAREEQGGTRRTR